MRIISGILRSRKIDPPLNLPVRPTTDRAKEGLFNILQNIVDFEESAVLDLFAGTGNISLEFYSRGCVNITAVEQNYQCVEFIKKASQTFNVSGLKVLNMNVFSFLKKSDKKYDVIFADPPYDLSELKSIPELIFEHDMLAADGIFILEHSPKISFLDHPKYYNHRKYGLVNFSFFRN